MNRVFNLAEPTYDFITDSYQTSKPYVLNVDSQKRVSQQSTKKLADLEMVDLIGYLGGEKKPSSSARSIKLSSTSDKLDFTKKQDNYQVQVKLDGGVPGKILNDQKANAFLSRVEYYIRNPNELVV